MHDASGLGRRALLKGIVGTAAGAALSPTLGCREPLVPEAAFGPQLAGLYGVLLRSLPVCFLQDDHDYGENDEASAELRTFLPDVERWLLDCTRRAPCAHLAHMPSTPVLWSAGKWGEWYPDGKDESGVLRAVPSGTLEVEEAVAPIEENGFSLLDVTPGGVEVAQFRWTPEQGDEGLDRLEPFAVHVFPRPGAAG